MPVVRFLRKVVEVPDTWEGWATRVLTVAVVIVFIASIALVGMVRGLNAYVSESRSQRLVYQQQETVRQCAILVNQNVSAIRLRELKC